MSVATATEKLDAERAAMRFRSLVWKVAALLGLGIGLVFVTLALWNHRTLSSGFEQRLNERGEDWLAGLRALLAQKSVELERIGGTLPILVTDAGRDTWASLRFELQLASLMVIGDDGELKFISDDDGHTQPPAALHPVLAEARESGSPTSLLLCHPHCRLYVANPFPAAGNETLLVVLGAPLIDIAHGFPALTGAEIAVLTPPDGSDATQLWQQRLALVSDAPTNRAVLERLAGEVEVAMLVDGVRHASAGHTYYLRSLPIATEGAARQGQFLLFDDISAEVGDIRSLLQRSLLLAGASLLLVVALAFQTLAVPLQRLRRLASALPSLAEGRYAELRDAVGDDTTAKVIDEFDQLEAAATTLAERLELLEQAVAERTRSLEQRGEQLQAMNDQLLEQIREREAAEETVVLTRNERDQLSRALEDLKVAQSQLVQAEKMAALGQLVTGVAHEINTPIGICVTAASGLVDRNQDLRRMVESGDLTRSALQEYLDESHKLGDLLIRTLSRAAELIDSFKLLAVDQDDNSVRPIYVREYLTETITGLEHLLAAGDHRIELVCDENLYVHTVPGALSQTVAALVQNAVHHGFEGLRERTVRIEVSEVEGQLQMRVHDDGKGIAVAKVERVFEPFFTTSRGTGQPGLGLNRVFNLVTGTLEGEITVASEPGAYTEFLIRVPLREAA